MEDIELKVNLVIKRFQEKGFAQVSDYNRFGYIKRTDKALVVSRENGEDTRIPLEKIKLAIQAVQKNNSVYDDGPSSLRKFGITHINSPVWALIHLLSLSEIKA